MFYYSYYLYDLFYDVYDNANVIPNQDNFIKNI